MAITFLDDEKEKPKGGITFLDDAGQPGIAMLQDSRPLTGEEITQFLADDPAYARRMSLKDYEELRRYKSDNPATFDAVGQALTKVGQDLSDAAGAVANNLTSPLKIVTALGRGALVGTTDLGDMIDKIITFDQAPNTYNLYRAKTNLPDNADTRKKYEELLAKDFSAFQESQDYQAGRAKVVQESDIPQLTEAASYVLDPTLAIPGAGAGKIGTIADKAIGAAVRTAGKATRFATRPVVDAVEGVAKAAAEAAGPAAKGAAAATGVTGVVMGVPGVREAAGAYAGLKTVDKAAQVAERVGESLMGQPSRVGPLEAMGRVPNASAVDRAIGAVGRRGGDAAIDIINATAGGALTGAAIGGALGFAAEGEEGLYGGIGSGLALGGLGAGLGRTYEKVRGRVVAEARAADLARFTEALDEPTRNLFKKVVERDGPDQAVMVMDGAALLRSQFDDAKVTFLPDTDFKERFGASARGVQLETAGRPEIVINVDKPVSAYTFGHELFHAFDSVEQLKPKSEAIKQEIVGTFLQQPDGTFTQVKAGLLSPDEVDVAFKQYQRKLAQSGAATREWFSAQTPVEKAKLVGKELASEYMARMVTGGDVDGLLRGYDGVTRTLLDQTLMKQSEGVLRGVAERLGLGSAPVESMLFKNLKDASPTLNAMLRDVIRARRNLSERMVLAEDNGVVITPRDISKPIVAEKAVQMGVAERRPDGTVAMKPDSVLASEEAAQSQAIKTAVETAPVADPTKPHLRVVDGEVRGAGISPEQAAAIAKAPGISNKLKESLGVVSQSLAAQATPGAPNGLWVEYGAATRRVKNRLTGSYTSKYSSGIRLSQREVVPYELYISKAGNPVAKAVDVSKLRTVAADLASNGRLGPYERDIAGFLSDSVRYFDNISDPNGVRTRELPGMTEPKATFLNQYFGQQEKGGARFIRDLRLDRITEIRPTGERIAASELAWQRQKVNWMPAEKMPEGEVWQSNEGYKIIKTPSEKFHLYDHKGERVGVFDSQAKAERRAEKDANLEVSLSEYKKRVGPEDRKAIIEAEKRITEVARENPEAIRLVVQRDEKGRPKIDLLEDAEGNPILDEKGRQKRGVIFEKVNYELRDAPGLSKNDQIAVKQGADLLEQSAKSALEHSEIRKGLGWYSRMRDFFQRTFGANIEAFGQLLGATSARTPVDTNFRQALEALKLFTSGAYDDLLRRYDQHVSQVKADAASGKLLENWKAENPDKRPSQFSLNDEIRKRINDFDEVPLRGNGAKYNANSKKVLQVLYGNWVDQTKGPKTPNFAGNLTGRTLAATIDVWAARNLRRLLYEGKRKQWRLLPEQETGVKYTLDKNGVYGGDFVFAQKIYDEVARRLNMNADDLQALMWFAEKDVWDRNGWTNTKGGEKSSFDKEAGKLNLRRYQGGITTFTDEASYSADRQKIAANEIRDSINRLEVDRYGRGTKEPGAVVARVTFTEGLYGNTIEPSLDVEFSLHRSTNVMPVLQKLVDIASRPESLQTDVFLSKLVDQNHKNARPGIEIGFKKPASGQDIQAVMAVFRGNGIDGFTVAKDPNGRIIGIRTQYVPEISGRYDSTHLDPQNFVQLAKDWMTNARKAKAALNNDNISYANEAFFSTNVVGREEYGGKIPPNLFGASLADELGRRKRAISAGQTEVPGGNSAGQSSERQGPSDAFRNDAGPSASAVGGQFMPAANVPLNLQPESMPNGTVYRSNVGFSVVNKNGGKYRVYSPVGVIVGVANSLEEAQRMIERKAK